MSKLNNINKIYLTTKWWFRENEKDPKPFQVEYNIEYIGNGRYKVHNDSSVVMGFTEENLV